MSLLVAKGCSLLGLANTLSCFVAPESMMDLYKADKSPHNVHLFKNKAAAMLSFSVAASYTLFVDPNIHRAMAAAQVPWFLQGLRSYFLDQSHKHLGTAKMNDLMLFVLCPAIVFGCWNQMESTTSLFGAFIALNGLSMISNPGHHAKMYDGKEFSPKLYTSLRALGFACLSLGTFALTMTYGLEPTRAFGYSWIPFAGMSLLPRFKEGKQLNVSKPATLFWVPVNLLAIGYCCFF